MIVQPNHIETVVAEVDVDGEPHLVKLSRYHDNQQFWTVPGERDERLRRRKTLTVTEPEPDEYELYDLTLDPLEERNLAHPSNADDGRRRLQEPMLALLIAQLERKRLTSTTGERPPAAGRHDVALAVRPFLGPVPGSLPQRLARANARYCAGDVAGERG